MNKNYLKPERISLKNHSQFDEGWVQGLIAEDPSILGLGPLVLRDKERIQPRAGRLDRAVTACAGQPIDSNAHPGHQPSAGEPEGLSRRPASYLWAALIARIYERLPLSCPTCGADMRLMAFLTEPASVKLILEHLGLPTEPPALASVRVPPLDDIDQTPAFDLIDPEPAPEYEFNQTVYW